MANEKDVSRRSVLKGAAVAGAGVAGGAALLAGCGSSKNTDPVTFTVRGTGEAGIKIAQAVNDAYSKKSGVKVTQQAVESDPFQNGISQYLQGTPDDVFGWMAGWRTNFYASQDLFHDVSANIKNLGDQLTAPVIQGATNPSDNKQYIIPTTYYPWGLHYRKSTMQAAGLDPENIATWDDLMKVMEKTKKAGLVAYPMGNKGGWEAMGTFDVINARVNGYQYHIDLLNGKAKWTDAKTLETFKYMAMLVPYMNANKNDIEWDGMRDLLLQKKAGVMMMGSWFANDFKAQSDADYNDLWIVPFPEINPEFKRDSIDAPLDGICVAANSKNPEGGAGLAEFWGSEEGMIAAQGAGDTSLYVNTKMDTSSYDAFNKQKLAVLAEAKNIMFFLDRDCRNDFASTVAGPALQNFLKNPKDVNKITESMQQQWDALPAL